MNLSDAEMRALVRLGYSLALADLGGRKKIDNLSAKNGNFKDGISLERLNRIMDRAEASA